MLNAFLAYGSWGLVPLYWKLLQEIPGPQILAHRVFWSVGFFGFLLWRWKKKEALSAQVTTVSLSTAATPQLTASTPVARAGPAIYFGVLICALLIGTNWFIYIQAVTTGHVLESSLGYFMNPLVNVALGTFFLGERLRRPEKFALALAAVGVIWIAAKAGTFPWIAITLAVTFGLYGLARKKLARLSAIQASFWESAMLAPLALGFLLMPAARETFLAAPTMTQTLLVASGAVTALPLYWFVLAARELPLSTLGFFQFLSPTFQFLCAIVVFGEPLSLSLLIGFCFIWAGLAVFLLSKADLGKFRARWFDRS